jgi:ribosomal protein S18 acetylase RimI-like enzyme
LVEIRKLPPDRWRDYKRLRLEALKQSQLAFGSTLQEEETFKEKEWRKRIKGVQFALSEGTPVGMIECAFNESVKFRHTAEIYSFYVKPSHRGKGTGTALLEHALTLIQRKDGIIKVRLYVNSKQRTAISMYKKAGFTVAGRSDREMKVGQRFYTMLAMEKTL